MKTIYIYTNYTYQTPRAHYEDSWIGTVAGVLYFFGRPGHEPARDLTR